MPIRKFADFLPRTIHSETVATISKKGFTRIQKIINY